VAKNKAVPAERYRYKDCPAGLQEEIYYLIRRRRIQMLVHSHIYYRMNNNLLNDKQFDNWAYNLRDLQKLYPEESLSCDLYKEFVGWDGTTGFHLPYYSWVDGIASYLIEVSSQIKGE
jgi:hypothetical protein